MGVKVYISGMSGNKEVKKRQQRVLMILESRHIEHSIVDITEPGKESEKDYMQEKSTALGATVGDTNPRHPLPPQLFNDEEYCGDYDQFDLANEIDELDKFLKLVSPDSTKVSNAEIVLGNGTTEPEPDSSEPVADSTENAIVAEVKEVEEDGVASSVPEVESSDIPAETGDNEEDEDNEDNEAEAD